MSETEQTPPPVPPFFAVGPAKFVVLSLTTFNFYQLIWLWQHWRHRREMLNERVLPAARAVLFPWLFTIPLGYRIAKAGVASGTAGWSAALVAAALWSVSTLGSAFLPDNAWALLSLAPVLPGLWLQHLANRVNGVVAPAHDRNARFTRANKAVVAVGGLLLLLVIVVFLLPDATVEVEEHF